MNKDQIGGKAENLKGRAKEAAGALTGDKGVQAEGVVDRVRGAVREKIGEVKEGIARERERREGDKARRDTDTDTDTE